MGGGIKAAMGEVALPCAAMVVVEGCIIALTIMASTAMARGMSPFVFVVYTNALGSILLLPYLFLLDSNRSQGALLTFPFLVRVFVLGLIGTAKLNWRSSDTQARIIGTLISFVGAISLTLYKGPTIKHHSSPSLAFPAAAPPTPPRLLVFTSTHENWVHGCILFAASSFTLAIWNIFQAETVKMCPQVMKIISLYSLFGTVQTTLLALYLERDPSAWKLELNFEILVIVLTVRL
ncbi:hypothetical protein CDL12_17538 [Handroanthus impetiginosus]|uniref:WAT1-related protein n=1 Tax=Handroanthus impetiginosus TaxID=429701 RepID=A0A2G9GX70_9LAMI|nr:hypothetical protein CDL12_17538 [Handroanthus impetiginosus]